MYCHGEWYCRASRLAGVVPVATTALPSMQEQLVLVLAAMARPSDYLAHPQNAAVARLVMADHPYGRLGHPQNAAQAVRPYLLAQAATRVPLWVAWPLAETHPYRQARAREDELAAAAQVVAA